MFDHCITGKEVEEIMGRKPKQEEDTNQEDVPEDVLKKFPDFIKQHNCCPRCKQNGAREQVLGMNEPLRFRCVSCGGVSLLSDWE